METLFIVECINNHLLRIKDITKTGMYLIIGKDKAILLDTGTGIGDLRTFLKAYLDIPYNVILTHGHVDHGSGAGQFTDKQIYLHPKDKALLSIHTSFENRFRYAEHTGVQLMLSKDLMIPMIDPEVTKPLYDNQRFDLGDIHLKIIETPGHTLGSCSVLIEEDRILITGDSCGNNVLLIDNDATTVNEYKQSLFKLKALEYAYDRILRNHGSCESDKVLIKNVLECCEEVLAGIDDHIPEQHKLIKCNNSYRAKAVDMKHNRLDGKCGNLIYRSDRIR